MDKKRAARGQSGDSDTPTTRPEDTTALSYALKWADRGGYIVPITIDKRPIPNDWNGGQGCSRDPEQIRAWDKLTKCTGFALLCGSKSGEVVIDVDAHHDGDVKSLGIKLPLTRTVRTPHGGTHYHFSVNGAVPTNNKLANGIELKGDCSLAILPGSQIALEGGQVVSYRLAGRVRRIAPLPKTLVRTAEGLSPAAGGDEIPQGSRNTDLTSLAGKMRYAGADEDEILLALRSWRERRCEKPEDVPDSELETIARSIGARTAGVEYELIKQRNRAEARVILEREAIPDLDFPQVGRTGNDYLAEEDDPLSYTIATDNEWNGWHVYGGNTEISARRKAGKTTLKLNIATALLDNLPFLGWYPVTPPGKLSIWDYEMIPAQFKNWLRRRGISEDGLGRLVEPLNLRGKPNPLLDEERTADWLGENDVKAWLIDPAMPATSGIVTNENSNSEMLRFTERLNRIKDLAEIDDVFLFHHMGASQFEEGEERGRGATRLEDWADGLWYLTKSKDGHRFLRSEGRGVNVESQVLQFSVKTLELRILGTRKGTEDDAAALAAVDALIEVGDGVSKGDLRMAIGSSDLYYGIKLADDRGYIDVLKGKGPKGGNADLCYITVAGQAVHERRVKVSK